MIDFTVQIIWLAAGLAVLASIVLFFLTPTYAFWKESKHSIDLESEMYELVSTVVEEALREGKDVKIKFEFEGDEDEKAEEESATVH